MATQLCQKCKQVHLGRVCDYDEKGECAETVGLNEVAESTRHQKTRKIQGGCDERTDPEQTSPSDMGVLTTSRRTSFATNGATCECPRTPLGC